MEREALRDLPPEGVKGMDLPPSSVPSPQAALLTRAYPPELIGSAPQCADLAEWLTRLGCETTVFTGLPYYPGNEVFTQYKDFKGGHEVLNGVRVERLRAMIPRKGSAKARILAEASFLLAGLWARASGRLKPKPLVISLCPSILTVALGCLVRQRDGRHVAIIHDIQSGMAQGLNMVSSGGLVKAMRWCERTVLNRVDLIVVLTDHMAEQLRDLGVTQDIEVVPIWVDTDRLYPDAPKVPANDAPAIIPAPKIAARLLYSGNFGLKQGLGQVLSMAEELQRQTDDVEIILRGSGAMRATLEEEIAARALRRVRVTGLLPPDQLRQGLTEGDIHLVPQEPEAAAFAIPSKIFNIMAVGRPFVTTANPHSPLWHLRERSGAFICVPPHDTAAFTEAVLRLVRDAGLRRELGARGRRFVEQHYSRSHVLGGLVRRLDALYAK
ncbi:glycosyltransferase [Nitrospirillum bahiense]|uniref:Colanic acid biosynthesis glycosyl transferase WcaI n=2 Tax=Nitrospirillum amazonense TaxID=28077 RepID=A0A560GDI3_9PROT|nr:glycosyltransferase [Nitrospirillum amazonense]TWB31975.1 colanic acid biosynthesis glycosyl transferase WcaI [Nitrospirillum amazonense]